MALSVVFLSKSFLYIFATDLQKWLKKKNIQWDVVPNILKKRFRIYVHFFYTECKTEIYFFFLVLDGAEKGSNYWQFVCTCYVPLGRFLLIYCLRQALGSLGDLPS